MDLLAHMDLLAIGVSVVALIVGTAIGWFIARSRFTTKIAELNTSLVLERRVNKQLSQAIQVDPVPTFVANYNGDADFAGSQSNALTLTVHQ